MHAFTPYGYDASSNATNSDGIGPQAGLVALNSVLYGTTGNGGNFGMGVLFRINADGTGFSVLHHFNGSDGSFPRSLLSSGTTLFGATDSGGTSGSGVVFSFDTSSSQFSVIYNFNQLSTNFLNADGSGIKSPLVLSGNTLYGAAKNGGVHGNGTVFSVTTDGQRFATIYSFTARAGTNGFLRTGTNSDGAQPLGRLAIYGNALFGTTLAGGADGNGTLFKLNTDGSGYAVLHAFSPVTSNMLTNGDGAIPVGGLTLSANTIYGTTLYGGNGDPGYFRAGFGLIFAINVDGSGFTAVHNLAGASEGAAPQGSLLLVGNSFYGTTSSGGLPDDTGTGTAFCLVVASLGTGGGGVRVTITPQGAAAAGAKWQVDGGPFQSSGVTLPHLSAGAHTIAFSDVAGWITPEPEQLDVVGNSTVSTVGSYTARDVTRPVIAVAGPKPGARLASGTATAIGTASDNVAVAGVFCALNGGDWTPAVSGNGWKNWSAPGLSLVPGTNVFSAYATDTSGNTSKTNTVRFVYVVTNQLTVQVVGRGTLTPNLNDKFLVMNTSYRMVETPTPGFAFAYWSGGVPMSAGRTLTFTMSTNLTIIANFVDVARPVDVITFPPVDKKLTNSIITLTGKARDNVGVSNVWYQLNTNGWLPVLTTNSFANWSVTNLSVGPGTNMVQSFAVDGAGNLSRTNSVRFRVVLP